MRVDRASHPAREFTRIAGACAYFREIQISCFDIFRNIDIERSTLRCSMQIVGSQRLLASQQAGVRSRPRRQLVAFTGFKSAGSLRLGSGTTATSLQAHVNRAIKVAARQRGVKCMRVTRMMFERFTEKAIKVVMLAQEEARRLGHNFVGTEQILLGLIGESTGELQNNI